MHAKPGVVHIIGAGVAGLTAAVHAVRKGHAVRVYEASPYAGGRCRSFHDKPLDATIDNGNHLLLGANHAVLNLIRELGAEDRFITLRDGLPFVDVSHEDMRWQLPPVTNIMKLAEQVPGTSPWQACGAIIKLFMAGKHRSVAHCCSGAFYDRLIQPLAVSIMNTPGHLASAQLFRKLMLELQRAESEGMTVYVPRESWEHALIQPMLELLREQGGVQFSRRITALEYQEDKVIGLHCSDEVIPLASEDRVILATPPWVTADLLPGVDVPTEMMPIVNVHFKLTEDYSRIAPVTGIIGGAAEWVFARDGMLSTTTSAAIDLVQDSDDVIAQRIWGDVQKALSLEKAFPLYRVIKEKRATFACTPENLQHRPAAQTEFKNLMLAGDYTDTGLPSTLEGAVRSGVAAMV